MARYICDERYRENAELASKIMGLAIGEVNKMQNKGDLPEGEDQFVASVQAHMNAQLHLHHIDASCELKESVDGIDPSNACPDLSDLESATRRGFEELSNAVDRIDPGDAQEEDVGTAVGYLKKEVRSGFDAVVEAIKRKDSRPWVER